MLSVLLNKTFPSFLDHRPINHPSYVCVCVYVYIYIYILLLFFFYSSSKQLLELIEMTLLDSTYILRILYELNIIPLALQITTICGNVMVRRTASSPCEQQNNYSQKSYLNTRQSRRDVLDKSSVLFCEMVHIKDPLLPIGKSSSNRFTLVLFE